MNEQEKPLEFKTEDQFIYSVILHIQKHPEQIIALFQSLYTGQKRALDILNWKKREAFDVGMKLLTHFEKQVKKLLSKESKKDLVIMKKANILDAIATLDRDEGMFRPGWARDTFKEYLKEIDEADKRQIERYGGRQGLRI
jgi:hypothetical protein